MFFPCHNPRRESCVSYVSSTLRPRVLKLLKEKGVDFEPMSRGGVEEYSDNGICQCLFDCVEKAGQIDKKEGREGGIFTEAAKSLALATLTDRRYVSESCPAQAWDDVEALVLASRSCFSTHWQTFRNPATDGLWYWNKQTEEFFTVEAPGDWRVFVDSQKQRWLWHEVSGHWFYESPKP